MTVLFADLVGFTSRSEQLDPEDVRRLLSPYYARLRAELESYGGTVEKFIGDAVMALFGAPLAHEDDPERAVRAALAIRDWITGEREDLQVRIAVNTGEVLVSLGAHPDRGEGMASGDVVNTTARLQSAAPVNGILVGQATYNATSLVITYRAAAPVLAKGKAEPIAVWEAVEARARLGSDLASLGRTPLIGRDHEIAVLTDALARVRHERQPHLLTVVGVPGIGKTRLLAELFKAIESDPTELIRWRQGRSLPYGEGVSFWALAEMVKAEAGILETDSGDDALEKLRASVAQLFNDHAERQWMEARLRPLAGVAVDADQRSEQRDEAFAAWRRYFEALAERNPLVLVFEDLHWADDNLLDFVENFVDWATDVPVLVVCTTRPEMFERRPGWAGGKRNATTISLAPLSDEETARLVIELLAQPVLAVETQQALVERAEGNPLYAQQYVRMLDERGGSRDLPLPESVQGIIAARLDALSDEEKRLLQAASVMGKVFWLGAMADAVGADRQTVERSLHSLQRKEFVQRARRSSVGGDAEYSFTHLLVRDVAYGQIPRAERGERHLWAAGWIEGLGRNEDHAETLAHHYLSALELRRAVGADVDAELGRRALRALVDAGDRAAALNAHENAARFYEWALELTAPSTPEHARVLLELGRARFDTGVVDPTWLEAAAREATAQHDVERAAEAESLLSLMHWVRGERDRANAHIDAARRLVVDREATRVKVAVLATRARLHMLARESEQAIEVGRAALQLAEQLGLEEWRASALNTIGVSQLYEGDAAGWPVIDEAIAIARSAGSFFELSRGLGNLAASQWNYGRLAAAAANWQLAEETAIRFGQAEFARWFQAIRSMYLFEFGRWDESEAVASDYLVPVEAGTPHYFAAQVHAHRSVVTVARGDVHAAMAGVEKAMSLVRIAKDGQTVLPTVADGAWAALEGGQRERAEAIVAEFLIDGGFLHQLQAHAPAAHPIAWTMTALGRESEVLRALPEIDSRWIDAARAYAEHDFARSASICHDMGAVTAEAHDRLALAEQLVAQGRRSEADIELQHALSFYRSVRAWQYERRCEALLAATA